MVEAISCVSPSAMACLRNDLSIKDITSSELANLDQRSLMQDYLSRAIAKAVNEPNLGEFVSPLRDSLTASAGNAVSERKDHLRSGVERPLNEQLSSSGDSQNQSETANMDPMKELGIRLRGLYMEVTEFSVAWSAANQCQKDFMHILKGQ